LKTLYILNLPDLKILKKEPIHFNEECELTEFTYIAQLTANFWIMMGSVWEDVHFNQRSRHAYLIEGDMISRPLKECKTVLCDFLFNFVDDERPGELTQFFKTIFIKER
jgi:hypothetical protein